MGHPRSLIIEAKKSGVHFELPVNPSKKVIQCLSSITKTSKAAKEALEQVHLPRDTTRGFTRNSIRIMDNF